MLSNQQTCMGQDSLILLAELSFTRPICLQQRNCEIMFPTILNYLSHNTMIMSKANNDQCTLLPNTAEGVVKVNNLG